MSNYHLALKANQDEILNIIADFNRQIAHLDKEIAEKDQTRQTLMKAKAAMVDYARLHTLELVGK